MKKRMFSWLLVLALVAGMLPGTALAAEAPAGSGTVDDPYQIGTAEELFWLAEKVNSSFDACNAVLTADIDLGGQAWTPIGKNTSYTYTSTFDGQGHTIEGLNITGSDSNSYGLFGCLEGGTVKNLTVKGSVEITGSGSSSAGVAAVVGQIRGTSGGVENCVNYASVTGGQNVGGIVGYVHTGYNPRSISNCANLGDITANGNNAGGVVGYIYGQVALENCYNRGAVTGTGWRSGGIVAYLSSSYATVKNCYTTGAVSGKDACAVIGNKAYGSVESLYYLVQDNAPTDSNATGLTEEELKAVPSGLGSAFIPDQSGLNGGYPILDFQVTKYPVSFTVSPAQAEVRISGATGTCEGDVWTFQLPAGSYDYTVSAFGYAEETGSFTVTDQAVERSVTLDEQPSKTVTFRIAVPEGGGAPSLVLTWNDAVIAPILTPTPTVENTCSYDLPYGEYQYTVRAKGCAKKVSELTVEANTAATIPVRLELSNVWDGESYDEPAAVDGVYQIATGSELAWLAQQVNAGNDAAASAVLTADIELGGCPWTPVGNSYSAKFQGTFDGQGHTVSGLNVSGASYVGLFGHADSATIKNVIVQGEVSGTDYVGGILGCGNKAVVIRNCASEATVTASGTYGAGGIVGRFHISSDTASSISNCYNTGAVSYTGTGWGYAGGILGYDNGNGPITDCYNVGTVTSGKYAGGIRGYDTSSGGAISNCYNTGAVTGGSDTYQGAIAPSKYSKLKNCYYLDTATADAHEGATAKTALELQQSEFLALLNAGSENWKQTPELGGGYPALSWQKVPEGPVTPPGEGYVLAESEYIWLDAVDPDTQEHVGEITPYLQWKGVDGAESYTITLWNQCYRPAESGEGYVAVEERIAALPSIAGSPVSALPQDQDLTLRDGWLYYDLTSVLNALEDGRYHATVTPAGEALPDLSYVQETIFGYDVPYNRLAPVTGLAWDGTRATWTPHPGFTAEDSYAVTVYRLNDEGKAAIVQTQAVPGNYSRVDCSASFSVGGRYAFSVAALADNLLMTSLDYTDSLESEMSEVYTVAETVLPDGEHGANWTAITTAEEWVDLANTEDQNGESGDPATNLQVVAWGKKYYLANDIDFSTLNTEYAAKTKSIGNVTNRFTGVLDGNGHKILGLTLSGGECGLFNYIGATGCVYDLRIEGANAQVADNAGVLVNNNYGTIERCCVVDSNLTSDTGAVLGGMVSRNYGVIRESCVQGGVLQANSETATGHGGFVGANERGGVIERCWTSMAVRTQSDYAGGFVGLGYGETDNPAVIRDCFSLGDVSARGYSGGFVGRSVYEDCRYENCFAAGSVTVTGEEGHGFIGGNKSDSAFQYDQSHGIVNCYYNAVAPADPCCPQGAKTLEEMKTSAFAGALNTIEEIWQWTENVNGGFPYLKGVAVPEPPQPDTVTATVVLATYDKASYTFLPFGEAVQVTMASQGNIRVTDVMDAAQEAGRLSYEYDSTPTMGRYIRSINGYEVNAPDGWMFTVNDVLSNKSASVATVEDGDTILWFEGTTANHFLPPTLEELSDSRLTWNDIGTVEELLALANSGDQGRASLFAASADPLSLNYRLTADLDLAGVDFPGIGSALSPYTGIFNGQGYTISNMKRAGTENVGFFNATRGATVKNLNLTNVEVSGERNVGAIVGYAQAALDLEDSGASAATLVGNCTVSGGSVSGQESVGGAVGRNGAQTDPDTGLSTASSVDKCVADVAVSGDGAKIGGLVGDNQGYATRSTATGAVTAPSAAMVGGLAGDNSGGIYDSSAAGAVTGQSVVGGFVGSSGGNVERSYALGDVAGQENVGGFAGTLAQADTVMSAGAVSGKDYVGGLVGSFSGTIVGPAGQITLKNAYANCPNGVQPVGNASQFQGEGNAAALSGMTLTEDQAVSDKLEELFQIGGSTPDDNPPDNPPVDQPDDPPAETVDQTALMDAIAANLIGSSDGWTVMDMARYSALPGKSAATTPAARQAALDALIAEAASDTATAGDRARLEIVLRSMGVDSRELYPAGQSAAVDNAARLAKMDLTAGGYYAAPWLLLAAQQGNLSLTAEQTGALITLLSGGVGDGLFGYEYGGVFYPDPDTAGATLAALAGMDDPDAQALRDKILAAIPGGMDETGSFGNANSDAMVILGLLAVGRDPAQVKSQSGASLVDGLLSHANESADGFLYAGEPNALATEQGFRALVALAMFNGEDPVHFYDFSANPVQPGKATGWQEPGSSDDPVGPSDPGGSGTPSKPDTDKTITVSFTLKTHQTTWLPKTSLELKEGATVYHALKDALAGSGITAVGLETGYIKSMTKGGVTLAEFDHGPNSGWLYQVNGKAPTVPFSSYTLSEGDEILWYYAADWTKDPAASRPVSGGGGSRQEKPTEQEPTQQEPEKDSTASLPFTDVAGDAWYYASVKAMYEKGLTLGTDATHFSPDASVTRGMVMTILARLAGQDTAGGERWYDKALAWAVDKGVSDGTAPEATITREQLAVMLYRYAKPAAPQDETLAVYVDASNISPWAKEAVTWAVEQGILTGKPGSLLDPQGGADRAQMAAVLCRWLTGERGPEPEKSEPLKEAGPTTAWLLNAVPEAQVGAVGGEWTALALAQSGGAGEDYTERYLAAAEDYVAKKQGVLDARKYTEYSRMVMTLTALGQDTRNVAGYDLTAPLADYDAVVRQGLNGAVWALLALDEGDYPAGEVRQRYVDLLLKRQLPGGGWSLTGTGEVEVDVTAMALRALAKYREQETVAQASEGALAALSAQQNADGSFSSWGQPTAESCAQVLLMLDDLGLSLNDPRFVREGNTVLDALMAFQLPSGAFAHTAGGGENLMATEQALLALNAARHCQTRG